MDFLNNLQVVNNVLDRQSLVTKRRKFTQEEDEIIKKSIVGDDRYQDWNKIAQNIPGKSARQCRERYRHYLKPGLNKEKWTQEEDKIIIEMHNKYGPNWALMAKSLEGRDNNDIKNRWNSHLRYQIKPTPIANQNQNNNLTQIQPTEQTNNNSVADFDFDFFGKFDDFDFNQNEDIFPNNDIFDNQFDGFYNF